MLSQENCQRQLCSWYQNFMIPIMHHARCARLQPAERKSCLMSTICSPNLADASMTTTGWHCLEGCNTSPICCISCSVAKQICVQMLLPQQSYVETFYGRAVRRRNLLAKQQALLDRELDLATTFGRDFATSRVGHTMLCWLLSGVQAPVLLILNAASYEESIFAWT